LGLTPKHITRYEYDHTGRLTKLTDPKNQITEWIYNAANQLTSKKYGNNSTEAST